MKWIRALLPLLLLGIGVAGALHLYRTRPEPAKKAVEDQGELVSVEAVTRVKRNMKVQAQGTLMPAKSLVVQPEVGGRVVWRHPALEPGGHVAKGDTLLRIDGRDYRLQAEQQEANVERAELQLRLERIQRELAKDEWRIIGEDQNATEEGRALALRDPQVNAAKVNLEAAKSAMAQARLSVGRTSVTAPFNAWVQRQQVEVGQLVGPQTQVATLIGTDAYWVQVSVPADRLRALVLPGIDSGESSKATVTQTVGGQTVVREGQILRLLGDLDPVGRLARLLVEVRDPLNVSEANHNGDRSLPLLIGAYVSVEFDGREIDGIVEVPRAALREEDKVYVYTDADTLEVRDVKIAWRTPETVFVSAGLENGDRLITSRLSTPIPGMRLRRPKPAHAAVPTSPKAADPTAAGTEASNPKP